MIDAPGPFAVRDDMPFPPRPDYAAWLGAILQPVVDTLGASDAVLVPAQQTIGTNNGAGFEGLYASTVGVADATLSTHVNDGNDQTAFVLDDRGNFTVVLNNQVAPYLPPVDTPIPGDFSEPPGPPQPTHPPQDEPPDSGNL
jgi:hypothetical protein